MHVVLHGVVGAQGESDNDVHYGAIGGGDNLGEVESDESVAELVSEDKPELDSTPATEALGSRQCKMPSPSQPGPHRQRPQQGGVVKSLGAHCLCRGTHWSVWIGKHQPAVVQYQWCKAGRLWLTSWEMLAWKKSDGKDVDGGNGVDGENGEEVEGSWSTNAVSYSLLVHEKKVLTMVELAWADDSWRKSMMSKMASYNKNKTWTLVPQLLGVCTMGVWWVHMWKQDGQAKLCLVAQGFTSIPGMHHHAMYAPVASFNVFCTPLAVSAKLKIGHCSSTSRWRSCMARLRKISMLSCQNHLAIQSIYKVWLAS